MLVAQRYSIAGPIVATLGLALVGSAIGSLAWRRGDTELRGVATSQTMLFLGTTLGGIGIQSQLAAARSIGTALAMIVCSALAVIVGLVTLARLLARAADAIDAKPGIPPARIV